MKFTFIGKGEKVMDVLYYTKELFLKEIKFFLIKNWWVFLLFISGAILLFVTEKGNLFEVGVVFMAHFVGDLFIMMMMVEYSKNNNPELGGLYQLLSTTILGIIGLYAGLNQGCWQYLIPNLIFTPVAIRNYFNAKGKSLKFVNLQSVIVANILLLLFVYNLQNIQQSVQIFGFIFFSTALIMSLGKKRYLLSLFGTGMIALGSFLEFLRMFNEGAVSGITISYSLLPLAVFISFIQLWNNEMKNKVDI